MARIDAVRDNLSDSSQKNERAWVRALHSLSDPTYRWWFLTQILSTSGSMAQGVAQSWLILRLTGNAWDLGLLGAISWAPVLLGGAWAGGLSDRCDRRRLLIATQTAFVALCAAQTVLVATGEIELWMIFVFGALTGTVMAVDGPARQVYMFELVGRERLASAVGTYEVMLNASRVFGPAAGGVLLASVGIAACFLLNALTYLPTLWVLLRFKPVVSTGSAKAAHQPVRIRDGLAVVLRSPELRSCILVAVAIGLVFNTNISVPLFASRALHLGGGGFGAMMACFGIGAVPGALMAAGSRNEPSGELIRVLALSTGIAVIATALTPVTIGAFIGIGVVGFTSIWLIAAANTLVQLRSSPELRGRIMGIWTMAIPGGYPVTGLLVACAAHVDVRAGFAVGGVAMLAVAVAIWTTFRRSPSGLVRTPMTSH